VAVDEEEGCAEELETDGDTSLGPHHGDGSRLNQVILWHWEQI